MEDQEIKRCLQSDYDKENSRLVYAINKFLNIFEMEELGTQPKL